MTARFGALALGLPLLAACVAADHDTYRGNAVRAREASEAALDILRSENAFTRRLKDSAWPERVADQAAADFGCPKEEIQVEPVYFGSHAFHYGASGCNSAALYAATPDFVYAIGPRTSPVPPPARKEAEEWHPGGGLVDAAAVAGLPRCQRPNLRDCAAELLGCRDGTLAIKDLGQGRWETAGCGARAEWTPVPRGWALDQ